MLTSRADVVKTVMVRGSHPSPPAVASFSPRPRAYCRPNRSPTQRPATRSGRYVDHRYYDPSTDQFISVDPLVSQTGQPFSFANDNPVNGSDPSGLVCVDALDPWSSGFGQCWSSGYSTAGHGALVGAGAATIGAAGVASSIGNGVGGVCSATWQGVRSFFNPAQDLAPPGGWPQANISDPNSFWGLSSQQADDAFPSDWKRSSTRGPGGTRISNPNALGEQGRIMPGNPNDPNPVKQGPYLRISMNGQVSDPIPLKGNPTLGAG